MALPMVVDLMKLRHDEGLRAMALTAMDEEELSISKAEELGVNWSIGSVDWHGEDSPYLNLGKTTGTTYIYLVGRTGGIEWRGDPSSKPDEFLAALRGALDARGIPPLKPEIDTALAEAVGFYVGRNFPKARATAAKVHGRFAKKTKAEAQAIAADAQYLIGLVDEYRAELEASLGKAEAEKEAVDFLEAHDALVNWFPKSDAAKDAQTRRKALKSEPEFLADVERWEAWRKVLGTRPPSFPLRREKLEKRFAKDLGKYLKKNPEGPGAEEAKAMLAAWEAGG